MFFFDRQFVSFSADGNEVGDESVLEEERGSKAGQGDGERLAHTQ